MPGISCQSSDSTAEECGYAALRWPGRRRHRRVQGLSPWRAMPMIGTSHRALSRTSGFTAKTPAINSPDPYTCCSGFSTKSTLQPFRQNVPGTRASDRCCGQPGRARCFPAGTRTAPAKPAPENARVPGKISDRPDERSERPVAGTDEAAQADPAGSHGARTAWPGWLRAHGLSGQMPGPASAARTPAPQRASRSRAGSLYARASCGHRAVK